MAVADRSHVDAPLDEATASSSRPSAAPSSCERPGPAGPWGRPAEAIAAIGEGALVSVLGAIRTPALLLHRGLVVHANPRGEILAPEVLRWDRAGRPPGFATVTPLRPGGEEVELVLVRCASTAATSRRLTPALVPVAARLALGDSDKEIAVHLDIPLATARTYVTRTLQRLGVRDRRALIACCAD